MAEEPFDKEIQDMRRHLEQVLLLSIRVIETVGDNRNGRLIAMHRQVVKAMERLEGFRALELRSHSLRRESDEQP